MKMSEARALMVKAAGYCVHFEKREGGMLATDYFPERNEPSIADIADAWTLAEQFAAVDPSVYVNVYVVSAFDWTPVANYQLRKLNKYPGVEEYQPAGK